MPLVRPTVNWACPYWGTVLTLENDSVTWVCVILWGLN